VLALLNFDPFVRFRGSAQYQQLVNAHSEQAAVAAIASAGLGSSPGAGCVPRSSARALFEPPLTCFDAL
jgi:hypothetical protein